MPISVSHALSATTPDDPAYEIRPSHWNSNHIATISAVGSEVIGAFSNAGNVSFGLDGGGYVTASANVTAAPSPVNVTGANGSSVNAQTIAFSNSNGMTLGVSTAANGATVTGSYTVPTQTAFVFSNSNGVSFGTNGSTVTATVATNYQSQGAYLTTAAQSNQVVNSVNGSTGAISLAVGSSLSSSTNGSSITWGLASNITTALQPAGAYLTTAAVSNHSHGFSASGGSSAFQTLNFVNGNGVTFTNNAGSVGASYTVPSVTEYFSKTNTTFNGANISGSITLNTAGLQLSLSAAAGGGGADGGVFLSAAGSSQTAGNIIFSNSNGLAFGMNGSTVTGSYTVPTVTNSSWTVSDNATSATVGRLAFTQANGITMSLSTSNNGNHTVFASHNGLTTQTVQTQSNVQGIIVSNTTYRTGDVSFSNVNGISFGSSAGQAITASYTVPVVTDYFSKTNTTFNGANISGSLTLNTAGLQMSLSVAAPGAAAENNNHNLLGANTAGNTTASGSTIGFSGINLTLSGTNGSVINFSAPATSSIVGSYGLSISTNGSTISAYDGHTMAGYYEGILDRELLATQIGNNQVFVQPLRLRNHIQFDEICVPLNFSNASNSSNSATLTMRAGIYTRNGSSLSLITQASGTYPVTASGTAGNYSLNGGPREYPMALTSTLTKGDYYIAFLSRTTSGGGAGMSWSNFQASNVNSAYSGRFSSANNATNQWVLGMGSYATTTTAFPSVMGFSDINGSAAVNLRPVIFKLVSGDLN